MAPTKRIIRATLFVRFIMGMLLCVVASSEMPELLTLSDQAANDYTISRTSEEACPDLQAVRNNDRPTVEIFSRFPRRSQPHTPCGEKFLSLDLLALHSVRRT